uniref:Uncharacterized protein n=1 Tax=Kalanchoe fedtschenkoi TaxID=63787 RepID=A0A7N0UDW2_KALFE
MRLDSNRDQDEFQNPSITLSLAEDVQRDQFESPRHSVVILPLVDIDKEHSLKKIVIKRPKEVIDLDMVGIDETTGFEYRKTKKKTDLLSIDIRQEQDIKKIAEESGRLEAWLWEEEERRNAERFTKERDRLIREKRGERV